MSHASATTLPLPSLAAAVFSAFASRPVITTVQPSRTKACARAKPIPRLPPVMTATLSFSTCSCGILKGISVLSVANERQELLTRILRMTKAAQHMGGHGRRMLLLHAPHHHAQVPRLDHHTHALGLKCVLYGLRDLHCK